MMEIFACFNYFKETILCNKVSFCFYIVPYWDINLQGFEDIGEIIISFLNKYTPFLFNSLVSACNKYA